jgi:hypothetical protein
MRLAWVVTHPLRAHRDHHHERKRAAFELGREYGAVAGRALRPPRRHLAVVVPIDATATRHERLSRLLRTVFAVAVVRWSGRSGSLLRIG